MHKTDEASWLALVSALADEQSAEMKLQTIWRLHNRLLLRETKAETGADIEGLQGRRLVCTIRRDKARIPRGADKKVPHPDPG